MALEAQTREIVGRAPDASKLKAAAEAGQRLMAEIAVIEAQALAAEEAVQAAALEAKAKGTAADEAGLAAGKLKTEVETLEKALMPSGDSGLPPILDQIRSRRATRWRWPRRSAMILKRPAMDEAPCTGV